MRPRGWYVAVGRFLSLERGRLPSLSPAAALADALKHRDGWVPDSDDIEFPNSREFDRFMKACKFLDITPPTAWADKKAPQPNRALIPTL